MAMQTDYGTQIDVKGEPGVRVGILHPDDVDTLRAGGGAQKVAAIVVATAVNSTTYTYLMAGQTVTFTSDGSATKVEIAAGLTAAHNALPLAASVGVAVSNGVDTITITGRAVNDDFAISEADANLTLSTTTAASAGSAIPFGIGVQRTSFTDCGLPGAGGDPFAGVALKIQMIEGGTDGAEYAADDICSVLNKGEVWVQLDAGAAPTYLNPVYYRTVAGAGEQLGAFSTGADGGDNLILANCEWTGAVQTASDGTTLIAKLRVHL